MTKDEALKMAMYELEIVGLKDGDTYNACKEALEQPAQEPYKCHWVEKGKGHCERNNRMGLPDVYTHPHQWQGLTDDEMEKVFESIETSTTHRKIYRAIEAKLKEKNL